MSKKKEKIDRTIFKRTPEQLRQFNMLLGKHMIIANKKGKGSYKRKAKYERNEDYD